MTDPELHGLTDNPSQSLWDVRHAPSRKDEDTSLEGTRVLAFNHP